MGVVDPLGKNLIVGYPVTWYWDAMLSAVVASNAAILISLNVIVNMIINTRNELAINYM